MTHSDADTTTFHGEPSSASAGTRSVEVSNAIARLHKHYVGRGPANVRTTIDGDLVVVLLEGGYTRAEETLGANDMVELVAASRVGLQDAMRQDLVDAVRDLLGREVVSMMSANDLERGLQVEVFVLGHEEAGSHGRASAASGSNGRASGVTGVEGVAPAGSGADGLASGESGADPAL